MMGPSLGIPSAPERSILVKKIEIPSKEKTWVAKYQLGLGIVDIFALAGSLVGMRLNVIDDPLNDLGQCSLAGIIWMAPLGQVSGATARERSN